ncbi:MAG: FHA domain-containing protein [Acidimicrobiales bacterium]|nr:FHA domain-containing protein [Acidimicrobiales bacterium]
MILKLSLQRSSGLEREDVLIDTDPGATVGQLAHAIALRDPRRQGAGDPGPMTLRVEGSGAAQVLDPARVIADAPVSSGDVVSLQAEGGRFLDGADQRVAAATLQVVEGPQQGQRFDLARGANQVGRGKGSDVRLDDPMVSKRHARFNVTDTVEVIDLGAVNGVLLDEEPVDRAFLRPGDQVLLGDTLLRLESINAGTGTTRTGPTVEFNRSPYLDPRYPGAEEKAPDPPVPQPPQAFPILMILAPMVFGIAMYAFTRNLLSVIFMALSPVMAVAAYFEGKRSARKNLEKATIEYRENLEHLAETMEQHHEQERAARRGEHPSVDRVLAAQAELGVPLWARRPDRHSFLDLRIGLAALPTRSQIELPSNNNTLPELWDELMAVHDRFQLVSGVPMVATLPECGVLGIAGVRHQVLGTARAVLAQVAGLHSPAEVVITALLPSAAATDWDWLKWLPHTTSPFSPVGGQHLAAGGQAASTLLAGLRDLMAQRSEAAALDVAAEEKLHLPAVIVLVDDDAPVDRPALNELAERGRAVGIYFVWTAAVVAALPASAKVFVDHGSGGAPPMVGLVDGGLRILPVDEEPLEGGGALAFARSLAPLIDRGARLAGDIDLPSRVSFLDQVGLELAADPEAVVERWRLSDSLPVAPGSVKPRKKAGPLHAIVGATDQSPAQLDLRAHGPHALVGGTTGSGKSEFLQSWVLGLAANHSPARLTFLFVDYKGGAAFSECVRLPHCVGMVTDLNTHLVRRALDSLDAEIKHREHILDRKKQKDVLELEKAHDPETPPSLVIVVDEFAALVNEVPEFVDGVVNVAQRGRSLGLHLILATQRPAGVIKDNLRANTNLRVALRMADEADSTDVIGTPMAAGFDPGLPGRGVAKMGPGRLTPFQAAYVGGWTTGEAPPPRISISTFNVGGLAEWPEEDEAESPSAAPTDLGPNDLHRTVETIISAASERLRLPAPRRPWQPELEETYDLARQPASPEDFHLVSRTDERLVFGVLDDPKHQAQRPVWFEPDEDGNLAVLGTGGAGKSAFLRTLAVAGGLTTRGGPCFAYGLDFASRGLDMLSPLPNVGAVIASDDEERVTRLLRTLRAAIDDRLDRYAAVRAGSITQYRKLADRPDEPRILLLVDGYPAFRQEYEGGGRLVMYDLFQSIATDGRQAGVHVVVAADRISAIPSSLASVISKRLVLRMASESEYLSAGVPPEAYPTGTPPGRGFYGGFEVQVAVLGATPNTARQSDAVTRLAEVAVQRGAPVAPEIGRLPDAVTLDEIVATDEVPVTGATVGISDATLEPFSLDLRQPVVISGPPKSGKTTAVVTVVQAIRRAAPDAFAVYIGAGTSPLRSAIAWDRELTPGDGLDDGLDALAEFSTTAQDRAAVLVIEDASSVAEWPAADRIQQVVERFSALGHAVVSEGETGGMKSDWGLLAVLKAGRRGLALIPDQLEDERVFKTALPAVSRRDFPPGRGLYVHNGGYEKVQVALPMEGRT